MLPAGWNTYIGVGIKVLTAGLAFLQYFQGHPLDPSLIGFYALGDGFSTSGQAKQSTVVKGIALQEGMTVDGTQELLVNKK